MFAIDLRPQAPFARVDIAAHDDPLDLGTHAVITGHHLCRRHQGNPYQGEREREMNLMTGRKTKEREEARGIRRRALT